MNITSEEQMYEVIFDVSFDLVALLYFFDNKSDIAGYYQTQQSADRE